MKITLATVFLVGSVSVIFADNAKPVTDKPNIVFIMADDLGRQATSCYNPHSLIQTPNIDRLARDGMRFTEAYANNSICSPSRAVLLTGKYNHLCGVRKLDEHFDGAQQTFPKLLQQAGYQTAIVGKWHLFTEPTGFDYFSLLPGQGRYYDFKLKESGQPWGPDGNEGGVAHQGYLTDVITDVSLNWLEHRDPSKPFCLMIHHKAPHEPHDPAPRHKELFKDTVFPEPPNLLDDYAGRAPEPVADSLGSSRLLQNRFRWLQPLRKQFTGDRAHDTRLMYQEYMRGYLRLIAALDDNVGRTLDYLDKTGLSKNTVVIFTSDNGFFTGEHGFFNKMWMYEESLHLPLIVRMPGVKAGSTNHAMVSMMDIAPTLLDLAGVKTPADMQGVSIQPLLRDKPGQWRDAFFYHYYGVAGAKGPDLLISREILGVRTKTSKLVYYPTWKNGPFWEYFDLVNDPHEMHNLYTNPVQQPAVTALKGQIRALTQQYKDVEAARFLDASEKTKL